ncbi:MAG: 2-iminoacetate synthase ThiH [Smithella sp.]
MSYYDCHCRNKNTEWEKAFAGAEKIEIEQVLAKEDISTLDFLALLSPKMEIYLEQMAEKAREITLQHFGRTIQLYAPIYVSDHCENQCLYCSFNARNKGLRKKLSLEEVEREAAFIAEAGLRQILLLTGESKKESPTGYIRDCVRILRQYFSSIAVEIYPLSEEDYRFLVEDGVDGLTIYQETYDEDVYKNVHPAGPKRNFRFRLEAPERGANAGVRQINIGVLLGLADWRKDVFLLGMHAQYLQNRFPDVEIGISVPRLRPHAGSFQSVNIVSDQDMVQIILALRLFMPRLGISLSTRENSIFRDNLLHLGITRMSAGSATSVGGYTTPLFNGRAFPQFEIADKRSVPEIMARVRQKGYEPVLNDWISGI